MVSNQQQQQHHQYAHQFKTTSTATGRNASFVIAGAAELGSGMSLPTSAETVASSIAGVDDLSVSLRYDEQENESYYDGRSDADDDVAKGRLKFNKNKLYGRDKELRILEDCFQAAFCPPIPERPPSATNQRASKNSTPSSAASPGVSNNTSSAPAPSSSIVFVSGYSGVGKSSLIRAFVKQSKKRLKSHNIIAAFGKYNERVTGDPFSAISESIRQMIEGNFAQDEDEDDESSNKDDDDGDYDDDFDASGQVRPSKPKSNKNSSAAAAALTSSQKEAQKKFWKELEEDLKDFSQPARELLLELCPSFSVVFGGQSASRLSSSESFSTSSSHKQRNSSMTADSLNTAQETGVVQTGPTETTESTHCGDDNTFGGDDYISTSTNTNITAESNASSAVGSQKGPMESNSLSIKKKYRNAGAVGSSSATNGTDVVGDIIEENEEAEEPALNDLQRNDLKQMIYVFGNFLRIFCKPYRPLIWVLDDLQWADAASLELLDSILGDSKIGPMLFCGLYRSNHHQQHQKSHSSSSLGYPPDDVLESGGSFRFSGSLTQGQSVNAVHPPSLLNSLLASRGEGAVTQMTVSNLCIEDVSDFIADTLDLSKQQVAPLTDVIYGKTLGNVFFCKQALEELARKNVIYYDLMCFQWQYNVDHNTALHSVLSDDVIQMVQAKLQNLPQGLQDGLMVAAYIGHSIDLKIVHSCLKSLKTRAPQRRANSDFKNTAFLSMRQLREYLELAVSEGLLVRKKGCVDEYKFAHDRIQEAAYRLPLKEETGDNKEDVRGRWLVRLSQKLIGLVTVGTADKEWMLFVAVQHLNKVPPDLVPDHVYLAKLNLRVANLCVTKASYLQAVELLRAAVANLERSARRRSLWREQYDFMLKLYNQLLQTEFGVGNLTEAAVAINEVLKNARFLKDKCTAQYTKVQLTVQVSDRDYALGAQESAKLLGEIGIHLPINPTKAEILKERCKLKIALGTRSMSTLIGLPQMEEDWIMKLLSQLALLAAESKNHALSTFIYLRSARLSLEQGGSKYLPLILGCYSTMLRQKEQYHAAQSFGTIISNLYSKSPQFQDDWEFTTGQTVLHSGLIHLKKPFTESIEVILANYRLALTLGNINYGFASAMHFPLLYYAGGLPLNALLEPKLILLEDKAKQLKQPSFLTIFQCSRQFLYNLQGKPGNGHLTELKGQAMDEGDVLKEMEGNRKRMAFRDLSIFRLILAFIFNDEKAMEAMIERLEEYPVFDLSLVREYLRCSFQGLAAFQLAKSKKNKKYLAMGQKMLSRAKKLDRIGSPNAHTIMLCYKAMLKSKRVAFDVAIEGCKVYQLIHLEAIMREHCGRMLIDKGQDEEAVEYLGEAMWLYSDWGALAKVKQLQTMYPFLVRYRRREASRASLTSCVKRVNLFGEGSTSEDPLSK